MNATRVLGIGMVVCFIGAGARAEDKPDYAKMLVGKWESTKNSEAGLPKGTIVEFTKDGKMKITTKQGDQEMNIEGTYKVTGEKLTLTLKVGDQENSDEITITKISDKEMATKSKEGVVVELARKK